MDSVGRLLVFFLFLLFLVESGRREAATAAAIEDQRSGCEKSNASQHHGENESNRPLVLVASTRVGLDVERSSLVSWLGGGLGSWRFELYRRNNGLRRVLAATHEGDAATEIVCAKLQMKKSVTKT